jgi:threonine dehydrogenase-like Zn-dependent dehydrogenase
VVNFEGEDPIEAVRRLTGGIGVDRAIDAVGVDAERPHRGPAAEQKREKIRTFEQEMKEVAPETHPRDGNWAPGDGPSQVLQWAVRALAKAGTLAIIGVYPESARFFPVGVAMNRNLTVKMGNCNHRKYLANLLKLVQAGVVDPAALRTKQRP